MFSNVFYVPCVFPIFASGRVWQKTVTPPPSALPADAPTVRKWPLPEVIFKHGWNQRDLLGNSWDTTGYLQHGKKYGWFNGILRGYGSWMAQTWWISWRCNGDEMRYAQIGILAAFIGICCYLWCVQFKGFVSWCCLTVFWWYIVGNGAFHTNLK